MLANALPPVLQAPVAAPAPLNAAGSGNGPESFARMLDAADARRQAAASKAPEAKPAAGKTPDSREAAAPTAERTDAAGEDAAAAEDTALGSATAAAEANLPADPAVGSDAAALLAGLNGLAGMAALPRQAQAEAATRAAKAAGNGRSGPRTAAAGFATAASETGPRSTAETLDSAGVATRAGGAAGARAAADVKGDAFTPLMHQARGADSSAEQAAETGTQRLQATTSATVEARALAAETAFGTAVPMATAAAAGTLHGGPGASAATPAHARLGASPGSPEFATQLGAQLSTFVREGVQHARLELHPLELGPVTVQIALDGTLARVNMAAEHASTRQALEQAMPALAGSLREAGLTLSGGGVFEQPRQSQPESGGTAGSGAQGERQGERGTAAAGADRGPAPVNPLTLRRRGVVDLVA